MMTPVTIQTIQVGGGRPLVLFAGPCVVEGRDMTLRTAETVRAVAGRCGVPVVFKASYKKANRTSGHAFTGIGMDEALEVLREVRETLGMPVITDIHSEPEAAAAAQVADVLQIPAFLCRQTELLQAAGRTGRVVNIKKGQFLAPGDMKYAAAKVEETGNQRVLLTERGTTFGYHNLVVDIRGLSILRGLGKKKLKVLDPFCGRGTTVFAARTLGHAGYGVDSSPVAAWLSVMAPDSMAEAQAASPPASGNRPSTAS